MPRHYFIHGGVHVDDARHQAVDNLVQRIAWYRGQVGQQCRFDYRVITTDAHGVDALVVEACNRYAIPCTAMGVGLHPRNGAADYLRILLPRLDLRLLVQMVDHVVGIGPAGYAVYEYAQSIGREASIKDAALHIDEPIAR